MKTQRTPTCPKCNSEVRCNSLGDIGVGFDYYYIWDHTCTNPKCDYQKRFDEFVTMDHETMDMGKFCPGCGYEEIKDNLEGKLRNET